MSRLSRWFESSHMKENLKVREGIKYYIEYEIYDRQNDYLLESGYINKNPHNRVNKRVYIIESKQEFINTLENYYNDNGIELDRCEFGGNYPKFVSFGSEIFRDDEEFVDCIYYITITDIIYR